MARRRPPPPPYVEVDVVDDAVVCPLCERPIPKSQRDLHHLVPKLKGGDETVALHRICHRTIHARFTESELARTYNTAEALRAHDDIARFIAWVKKKPPEFHDGTKTSNDKRGPRGKR